MTYELTFLKPALKEWNKLSPDIRAQFKKKLYERLQHPRIVSASLSSMPDCYKIKLKALGYRLVYRVYDQRLVIQVVAIGKREDLAVYKIAKERLH